MRSTMQIAEFLALKAACCYAATLATRVIKHAVHAATNGEGTTHGSTLELCTCVRDIVEVCTAFGLKYAVVTLMRALGPNDYIVGCI